MPKKRGLTNQVIEKTETTLASLWIFLAWMTGVLVALAVGFGMVSGSLRIPLIPLIVTQTAGWIVVILTFLGAALKIIDRAMK
jgi:hypothetical protein